MIHTTNRFQQAVTLGLDEDGETIETPYVEPLKARLETTLQGGDDLYINRKFLAIMEHPDNAEIVRQVNMILPMSDPDDSEEIEHDESCQHDDEDDEVTA